MSADLLSELEDLVRRYEKAASMKFSGAAVRALTNADDKAATFFCAHHAEIAAAVRDAERYRWLRDKAGDEWEVTHEQPNGMSRVLTMFPGDVDETIDAAMSQEGEG